MATTVEELLLKISADTQAFQKSMDEVNKKLDQTSKATEKTGDSGTTMALKIGAATAGFTVLVDVAKKVATALYDVGKASWSNVDALGDLAAQTGVAVDDLQRFQYAATLTGSSAEGAAQLLRTMQLEIGQAGKDGSDAAKKFNDLGLSVSQLKSVGAVEAAALLADKVASVKDASEQAELAMQLFGRGARENLVFIKEGGENMRVLAEEAKNLGIGLSTVDVKYLQDVNDRIDAIKMGFQEVGNQLAIAFAPFIKGVVVTLMGKALGQTQDMAGSFNVMADSLAAVFDYINSVFQGIKVVVDGVLTVLAALVTAIVAPFDAVFTGFKNLVVIALGAIEKLAGALKMTETAAWANAKAMEMAAYNFDQTKLAAAGTAAYAEATAAAFKDWAASGYTFRNAVAAAKADLDYMRKNPTKPSGGGSGGDAAPASQAEKDHIASSTGDWARYYARRKEMDEQFRDYYADLMGYSADPGEAEKAHLAALEMNWEEHYKKREEMGKMYADHYAQNEDMTRDEQYQAADMFFGNMASLMQSGNKKMFEIGKVAAIAQATVDTYMAAQSAFAWGTKAGGPALGYALAASAVVAGLMRVNQITNTKIGGGGGGGGGSFGTGDQGTTGASGPGGTVQPNRQNNVNVTLQGERFGQSQVRALLGEIQAAMGDNVNLSVN